jgi:hypothetical protein
LKRSDASTIASSRCESRLRIGSSTTGSTAGFLGSKIALSPRRLRRLSATTGEVGLPSLTQPCSTAVSWQSAQTSTNPSPSGE